MSKLVELPGGMLVNPETVSSVKKEASGMATGGRSRIVLTHAGGGRDTEVYVPVGRDADEYLEDVKAVLGGAESKINQKDKQDASKKKADRPEAKQADGSPAAVPDDQRPPHESGLVVGNPQSPAATVNSANPPGAIKTPNPERMEPSRPRTPGLAPNLEPGPGQRPEDAPELGTPAAPVGPGQPAAGSHTPAPGTPEAASLAKGPVATDVVTGQPLHQGQSATPTPGTHAPAGPLPGQPSQPAGNQPHTAPGQPSPPINPGQAHPAAPSRPDDVNKPNGPK